VPLADLTECVALSHLSRIGERGTQSKSFSVDNALTIATVEGSEGEWTSRDE